MDSLWHYHGVHTNQRVTSHWVLHLASDSHHLNDHWFHFGWAASCHLCISPLSTVKLAYKHKYACTHSPWHTNTNSTVYSPSEAVSLTASPPKPNQYWPWKVTRSPPLSGIIHQLSGAAAMIRDRNTSLKVNISDCFITPGISLFSDAVL